MTIKDLATLCFSVLQNLAVTKYLVDIWCGSKCPDTHECKKCKYNELCAKLDELTEVVK